MQPLRAVAPWFAVRARNRFDQVHPRKRSAFVPEFKNSRWQSVISGTMVFRYVEVEENLIQVLVRQVARTMGVPKASDSLNWARVEMN
jgi:hypothetical protein